MLVAGNDTVEEIYGWKFQVGDKVTLHYYDGSGMAEKEVEVAGMLSDVFDRDHNGIEGWFVMPELTMETLAERPYCVRTERGPDIRSHQRACHIYHDVQYPQYDEYAHHKHRDPQAGTGHAGVPSA